MNKPLISISNLEKKFISSGEKLVIFSSLSLGIPEGTNTIITGKSGCGKSTLLNIIAGLDTPTNGSIIAGDFHVEALTENELTQYRSHFLGLVFQFHHLLKDFTALENVFLPAFMTGVSKKQAQQRAEQLLCDVGLENRMNHLPSQMSGGERQRAAVARALINDPSLVLADEPTGNLDPVNAKIVEDLLFNIVKQYSKTLILVTHDSGIASRGDQCFSLDSGKLITDDKDKAISQGYVL